MAMIEQPISRKPKKPGVRELAVQATRERLLRAATRIFAKHGLEGGSIDKIAKAAKTYQRMIYYYFGNKEGLYRAVLENTYLRFNEAEAGLMLNLQQPIESLCEVVHFIVQYYRKNPEFVSILNNENLYRGKYIGNVAHARDYSSPTVSIIDGLLRHGAQTGVFRPDLAARDLYLMIAALGYFYQSNRFTLSAFFGENLEDTEAVAHWERFVIDAVLRTAATGRA